ncbi:MAG TPA: tetratricopeptide repeat protein [Terriglobia bacterium]|nr:tetratricopeptide repeat protein [Terriglobia bacterium]
MRHACRLDSGNPEFQVSLGEALPYGASATSHFRTALQLCRCALRKRPNDADVYFIMGRTLNHLDDDAGALAAFRKAIALRPEFAEAYYELSEQSTRSTKPGADLLSEEEALAAMREAVRLKPEHAEYRVVLATSLSLRDDHPGAIAEYREAIQLQPDDPETHCHLGLELDAAGNRDGAEAEFREAVRLDPRIGANGYFNRCEGFIFRGDAKTAISFLRKSVEVYPLTHAWNTLGVIYHLSGNLDKAVESYREALRTKRSRDFFPTDHIYAHNNLGVAFEEKRDFESALQALRSALRLDGNNHTVRANMAVVFEKMGDLRRALEQYEKVLKNKYSRGCELCRSNYARLSAEFKLRSARRPRWNVRTRS